MIPQMQEQERKHPLPLWVRWTIVLFVLLLTAVGAILWVIQGSWAIIPTVVFAVLTVLLTLFQLLPSLFLSGRHEHSMTLPPQLTSEDQHVSPVPPLSHPLTPPGIVGFPQNPTATT